MKNTRLLLTLLFAGAALADTCPPVLYPDSVRVALDCPGLGSQVVIQPGTYQLADFNDNYGVTGNDWDYNDQEDRISTALNGQVTIMFVGSDSAWDDVGVFQYPGSPVWQGLWANNEHPFGTSIDIGYLPSGTVLTLGILSPQGYTYVAGPGANNPDGQIHAWVSPSTSTDATPEPRMWPLLLVAMGAVVFARRGRLFSKHADLIE